MSDDNRLAADSELRKPWKEMNPLLAIEEAKLLPIPFSKRLPLERVYEILAEKELEEGTPEYNRTFHSLTAQQWRPLNEEEIQLGLTRCPLCRRGYVRNNTCPCCMGFIFVPEGRIMGYLSSLNEISETERIDKAARTIVKAQREKKNKVKARNQEKEIEVDNLFGGSGKIPKGLRVK